MTTEGTPGIRLAGIYLYPIKSIEGVAVEQAELTPAGGLQFDRRWVLRDAEGGALTAKRCPALQRLQVRFDLAPAPQACLGTEESQRSVDLSRPEEAAAAFTEALGMPVQVTEHADGGLPDDLDARGPTVVSRESLVACGEWFGLPLEEVRRRFRANLEIEGGGAFWEDRLIGPPGQAMPFQIGAVRLAGIRPCQRCAVPSRDSRSGEMEPGFAQQFSRQRERRFVAEAARKAFDHFYRMALNTRVDGPTAGRLQLGDRVTL